MLPVLRQLSEVYKFSRQTFVGLISSTATIHLTENHQHYQQRHFESRLVLFRARNSNVNRTNVALSRTSFRNIFWVFLVVLWLTSAVKEKSAAKSKSKVSPSITKKTQKKKFL